LLILPGGAIVRHKQASTMVNLSRLWQNGGMTEKRDLLQNREDRKVQKLVKRIVQQQPLQGKAGPERDQAPPSRS